MSIQSDFDQIITGFHPDPVVRCSDCTDPATRLIGYGHTGNGPCGMPDSVLLCYPHMVQLRQTIADLAAEERRCKTCHVVLSEYHDIAIRDHALDI